MSKNVKKFYILIAFVIILLVLSSVWALEINKNDVEKEKGQNNIADNAISNEEYVEMRKDVKVNKSSKLKERKVFDELIIENIRIETQNNQTVLVANIQNPTNKVKGDYAINIIAKRDDGTQIKTVSGYINSIEPNSSTTLRVKTSFDFANTFDISIEKK